MCMSRIKNITRYEASKGISYAFSGWRICITRQKERFVRYFSDREHGFDPELALRKAVEMRDAIYAELEAGSSPSDVFERYRKSYS